MYVDAKLPISVARLVHDLLNPLSVVHASLTYLIDSLAEDRRDAAHESLVQTKRLERMLRELQEFNRLVGRRPTRHPIPLRAADAARRAIGDLEAEAKLREVTVEVVGDVQVAVEPGLLVRALTNLLAVAIRYAKPRTAVIVSLTAREGGARIEVRDQGPPPSEEERMALMRAEEYQGTPTRPGAALPMAFAHAEVAALAGNFSIETGPGGTSSVIEL